MQKSEGSSLTGLYAIPMAVAAVAGIFLVNSVAAQAASWRVTPRITVSASYTDNVDLEADTSRSDAVLRVNPGISVTGRTGHTTVDIDYTGSFMSFVNEGREEWRNDLRSSIHFEPVREKFYIDATATIAQPIVDELQSVSFSNANFSRNRRETISVSASPNFKHRLGKIADVQWGYTFRFVTIEDPRANDLISVPINDYINHVAHVRIDSGNRLGRFRWDIDAFYDQTDRGRGDPKSEEVRARLNVEYRVVRWLGVLGSVGWERIDFADVDGQVDEVTWNAGLRFNPSRNTDVTVKYGRQSGSENFDVDANYKRKRLKFFIKYNEKITTSQREFANVIEGGSFDDQGNFVSGLGDLLNPEDSVFGFTNEAYRRKRLESGVRYDHRLTTATLRVFHEIRTFDVSDDRVNEVGATLAISRDFSPRASGSIEIRYRNVDFDMGPSRVDDIYGARVSFDYKFSQHLTGVLSYIHSRRDSNRVGNKLRENVATVSLRASF